MTFTQWHNRAQEERRNTGREVRILPCLTDCCNSQSVTTVARMLGGCKLIDKFYSYIRSAHGLEIGSSINAMMYVGSRTSFRPCSYSLQVSHWFSNRLRWVGKKWPRRLFRMGFQGIPKVCLTEWSRRDSTGLILHKIFLKVWEIRSE